MKTAIAILTMLALITVSGCAGTTKSPKGGIVPQDEGFSITVPTSTTVKQGASMAVTVTLNRGDYFKRDVQLEINVKPEGISVTPTSVLVKASEKPEVQLQIAAARDAALGDYRVSVKATPETGEPTSTTSTVTVIAQ